MLALRLHGPRDARLEQLEEPLLRSGTAKVRITAAGICGSDLMLYEHAPIPADLVHPITGERGPHVLGHEMSGRVEAIADDVSDVAVGDLVAIRPNLADGTCAACRSGATHLCEHLAFVGVNGWGGAFSEAVVLPAEQLLVVPDELGDEAAALIEPLAVAWHAVELAGAATSALVVGAGPIGLALLLCLRARGVATVVVSEVSPERKRLAAELGADVVVDPRERDVAEVTRAAARGSGVDVAFDASGVGAATLQPTLDALRPQGRSVLVATFHGDVPIDVTPLLNQERTLLGSFAYTHADFEAVLDALLDGRLRPAGLVTSRISLEQVVERGLEHLLGAGRASEVKVMVRPAVA